MITVITGSREEALRVLKDKVEKSGSGGASLTTVTDASLSTEVVSSYFGDSDLFGKKQIIFLDRVFANPLARDFFWKELVFFAETTNEFILYEDKILADELRVIERAGGEIITGKKASPGKPKPEFSIFSVADALGSRDKKNIWITYEKAIRRGETPEALSGVLFWQIKNMLIFLGGGGATLSPFVKSKVSRFVKNYSKEELESLSFKIVDEYHKSRRGGLALGERLERLILSL